MGNRRQSQVAGHDAIHPAMVQGIVDFMERQHRPRQGQGPMASLEIQEYRQRPVSQGRSHHRQVEGQPHILRRRPHVFQKPVHFSQHAPALLQEYPARRGEAHAVAAPVQELHAHLLFEAGDFFAERRLCHKEQSCRLRIAPKGCHCGKCLDIVLRHRSSLFLSGITIHEIVPFFSSFPSYYTKYGNHISLRKKKGAFP